MSTPHHHHHHHHQHAASSASAPDPSDEEERQRLAALWVPSANGVAGSLPKPHRHIHIDWPNASIKKTLSIGASAPDASPPIYDRPLAQNESSTASSCVLITKSSPINATVFVSPEPSPSPTEAAQKPVLISAKTGSVGSVNLTIPSYTGARPLTIKAKSYNGNITIYLPSSFGGMLTWNSETGTLKVSKAMQQRFKALDNPQHKHRGTAKISPSTASGLRGDVCEIANHHGSITVKDVDEAASSSDDGGKSCVIQ